MDIEKIYTSSTTAGHCMYAVRHEGAVLLRGFTDEDEQERIVEEVLRHELQSVDRTGHMVPEQFQDTGWQYDDAPPAVWLLGRRICSLVRPELPEWQITDIRAQLYAPGEVGIEWHRDYKRDVGVVAVASFIGVAFFDIELSRGRTSWLLQPGDLVLMRGALLNGKRDDRPRHRVKAPETGQRLSVAYRQVLIEVPDLEPANE